MCACYYKRSSQTLQAESVNSVTGGGSQKSASLHYKQMIQMASNPKILLRGCWENERGYSVKVLTWKVLTCLYGFYDGGDYYIISTMISSNSFL